MNKIKIYFASPFFNKNQIEREERLKFKLRSLGFDVYSPKENCNLPSKSLKKERLKVFTDNCNNMSSSDLIFAITDEKDIGTIWEAGYGFAKKIPVIYYAETLDDNPFNLMLAQSAIRVYKSEVEINRVDIVQMVHGNLIFEYEGDIE